MDQAPLMELDFLHQEPELLELEPLTLLEAATFLDLDHTEQADLPLEPSDSHQEQPVYLDQELVLEPPEPPMELLESEDNDH
jgi:hypothetical protein